MKVGLVMQCSNCGGVIQKDDKFCAHCGSKTEGHGENHSENNLESVQHVLKLSGRMINFA